MIQSCLLIVLSLVGMGCGRGDSSAAPLPAASEAADFNTRTLSHDFGLVAPASRVSHEFVMQNTSDKLWTIDSIVVSCGCIVAGASQRVIPQGGQGAVTVEYQVPNASMDHEQEIKVSFAELGAPQFVLRVVSHPRQPLAMFPSTVQLGIVGEGESAQSDLIVENFSDHPWTGILVAGTPEWLTTQTVELPINDGSEESSKAVLPRQSWRVALKANASSLISGRHRSYLSVSAVTDKVSINGMNIPVEMVVTTPVAAIPGRWFIGEINSGEKAEQHVVCRFASPELAATNQEAIVRSSLPNLLSAQFGPLQGSQRILTLNFHAPSVADEQFVEGTVTVDLRSRAGLVEIPVSALVKPNPSRPAG